MSTLLNHLQRCSNHRLSYKPSSPTGTVQGNSDTNACRRAEAYFAPHTDTAARRSVGQGTRAPCTSRARCTYFHNYKNPPHKHCRYQNSGAAHQQHHALSRERCTRFGNYQKPPHKHCRQAGVWDKAPEHPALSRNRCTQFHNYKTPHKHC